MNQLCLFTNLSSSEWAAWVQAVGSVLAIVAAALIAIMQSRLQHRNDLDLLRAERRLAKIESAKTLLVLATNSSKAMKYAGSQVNTRESLYNAAEGHVHCDIGEVARIDQHLAGLPIHALPDGLVTLAMILGATVRQFREKVEMALRVHRQMDATAHAVFFGTLAEMISSIESTCGDITAAVERMQLEGNSMSDPKSMLRKVKAADRAPNRPTA